MASRKSPNELDSFAAFPEPAYGHVDLTGLAAYTIKRLQDLHTPATFENLVVAMFRLFPGKFSLQGYRKYPDAARVNRTLLQLGPKYRNWARGSVQTGFALTPSGVAKAESVAHALASGKPALGHPPRPAIPRTMDLQKELRALETASLFGKWRDGHLNQGEPREVFDLLGAYAYTSANVLRGRLELLEASAVQLGREDLRQFLQAVRRQFSTLFRSQ